MKNRNSLDLSSYRKKKQKIKSNIHLPVHYVFQFFFFSFCLLRLFGKEGGNFDFSFEFSPIKKKIIFYFFICKKKKEKKYRILFSFPLFTFYCYLVYFYFLSLYFFIIFNLISFLFNWHWKNFSYAFRLTIYYYSLWCSCKLWDASNKVFLWCQTESLDV